MDKIFVVAEMACAHDGSIDIAKEIIDAAKKSGADAINVQMTVLEDYMVPTYNGGGVSEGKVGKSTIFEYLEKLLWFGENEWRILFNHAKKQGLIISVTCNDIKSAEMASRLSADMFQIHSSSLSEERLVRKVASFKKPICLKIGGSYLAEIEKTISWIREEGNDKILLQAGFQNYPTKIEDMNLKLVSTLQNLFGYPVGYGDHVDGGLEPAKFISLLAIPYGVAFIEKHLVHNRDTKPEDFESALNPSDFKDFVKYVRMAEKALGSENFDILSDAQISYRNVSKKKCVLTRNMKKGSILKEGDVSFKRSDEGVLIGEHKHFIGKRAVRDLKTNDPLKEVFFR